MERAYWDDMADYYEAEIFSVFDNDHSELLLSKLTRYGANDQHVSDIGCGIGKFLPALSDIFKSVLAIDHSPKCIARAKDEYSHLSNVAYMTADLAAPKVSLPDVDFSLCVNAIITSSLTDRNRMLDTISDHLREGAHLILVVPSLESAFLTDFRLIEWNLRDGLPKESALKPGYRANKQTDNPRLHEGIVEIEDVPTKHYLKEELVILLEKRGLQIIEIEKIEYPWKTEFTFAPRWMKEPLPWDWLIVAKKDQ